MLLRASGYAVAGPSAWRAASWAVPAAAAATPAASSVLAALPVVATPGPAAGMATIRDIRDRLKGVKNMRKITKAMKMVAASKLKNAERALGPAVAFEKSNSRLTVKLDDQLAAAHKDAKHHLVVLCTSDKGLCGAVNSSLVRLTKNLLEENVKAGIETRVVLVGEKGRAGLFRGYRNHFLLSFSDFGKNNFNYTQAAYIADRILTSGYNYDKLTLVSNTYKNTISYYPKISHMLHPDDLAARRTAELSPYELEGDGEIIVTNYQQQYLANMIYSAFVENTAVEMASRMNAMDAASKNAGEMIASLTILFNRTRQAVITGELIEIISGASAL